MWIREVLNSRRYLEQRWGKGTDVMEVEVAEWSKALDSGSSPKGRGFKSRPLHFLNHNQSLCLPLTL